MKKLTILCLAISEMGHMNATIGVAIALKKRGHRVVFAAERSWKGKLEKYGFEEELYDEREKTEEVAGKQWSDHISQFEESMSRLRPEEKMRMLNTLFTKLIDASILCKSQMKEIIENVKPDVVVEDYGIPLPALIEANVPIIKLHSVGPLMGFNDHRLPPIGCGLPLNDSSEWNRCRKFVEELTISYTRMSEWIEEECPQLPKLPTNRSYVSTNLNIYMYPKTLVEDYLKLCPLNDNWIGVDHCVREPFGDFSVPRQLESQHGNLIFFSLGSMGSSFVGLMRRLIKILANSKHKFIVSLGHRSNEFELAENMWGEQCVPQLAVLPHVDLVLTHGGNNSFVETLYFGKPMIVLPLFGDQHDNAQRVVEMNIGRKFDPFTVGEDELNEAIDALLSDSKVVENVQKISKEMRESNSMERVIEKIEYVAEHPKFPAIA